MKTLQIVIYSRSDCSDSIVSELNSLDQYLSRHVRDRVIIRRECVCAPDHDLPSEAANMKVPLVRVGRHLLVNPTLAEVLDTVQVLSALDSSGGSFPRAS